MSESSDGTVEGKSKRKPARGLVWSDAVGGVLFAAAGALVVAGVASAVIVSRRPRPPALMVMAPVPVWPAAPAGLHAPIAECEAFAIEQQVCAEAQPANVRAAWRGAQELRVKQFHDTRMYMTTLAAREALTESCTQARATLGPCATGSGK